MIKISSLVLLLLLPASSQLFAQDMDTSLQLETEFKKHSIYLELLGNGLSYSINYERLLKQGLSLRMGAGYFPELDDFFTNTRHISLPILLNSLININRTTQFEAGLGTTFLFLNPNENFYITSSLGIKSVDPKTGKFFKVSFTPFTNNITKRIYFSGGLSLGKTF
tara:strand:- start:4320 stop:4817 length:498 start_codon:yes stop_codon:yes gene_type:complete